MRTVLFTTMLFFSACATTSTTEMVEVPTPGAARPKPRPEAAVATPAPTPPAPAAEPSGVTPASPEAQPSVAAPPSPAAPPPGPAAAPTPPVAKKSTEQARIEYDETYIDFKEQRSVQKTEPFEGRFQRFLPWPEFYSKVGRSDLAERSQTRRTWGSVLLGGGVILGIGGIVSAGAQAGVNAGCHDLQCSTSSAGFAAAGVLLSVGLAATLAGSLMPTDVVPAWDARRLGADYNWRLKQALGLR